MSMLYSSEKRRRDNLHKQLSIKDALRKKDYEPREISEDTRNRQEINNFIRKKAIVEHLGRNDILNALNETFSDSKYDKYRDYFQGWIYQAMHLKPREQFLKRLDTALLTRKEKLQQEEMNTWLTKEAKLDQREDEER